MSKIQHTPEPWRMWDRRDVDQGILITDAAGKVGICRVIGESQEPRAKAICLANAELILAAPALRRQRDALAAALRAMMNVQDSADDCWCEKGGSAEVCEACQCRAALAALKESAT